MNDSPLLPPGKVLFDVMDVEDLPAVMWLEERSFSAPWSEGTYRHELLANPLAFYWVIRPLEPAHAPLSILAYGGFWLGGDEAHIVTIASHPALRGRGLGELMLLYLLYNAAEMGAQIATLEVRPSNQAAIALYEKWGFVRVGVRKRYYHDNGEDALLYTLEALDDAEQRAQVVDAMAMGLYNLSLTNSQSEGPNHE